MQPNPVWSDELQDKLSQLTRKQAAAIPRLAAYLAQGKAVDTLLNSDSPICSEQTYYGRPAGWTHQPAFKEALALAIREYRQALAKDAIELARTILMAHGAEAIERTIGIMRQSEELAQARLAARDVWRELFRPGQNDNDEDAGLVISFQVPNWAKPEEPPDSGNSGD